MSTFHSADQVLKWAYNTSARPVLKLSSIYGMRGPGATAPSMSPFEQHAQAAQILRAVDALVLIERAYVHANYARQVTEDEYEALREFCAQALQPGLPAPRSVVLLLSNYMGQQVGLRAIRKDMAIRQNNVPMVIEMIFAKLSVMHERVLDSLDNRFRESGLIGGED